MNNFGTGEWVRWINNTLLCTEMLGEKKLTAALQFVFWKQADSANALATKLLLLNSALFWHLDYILKAVTKLGMFSTGTSRLYPTYGCHYWENHLPFWICLQTVTGYFLEAYLKLSVELLQIDALFLVMKLTTNTKHKVNCDQLSSHKIFYRHLFQWTHSCRVSRLEFGVYLLCTNITSLNSLFNR